MTGTAQDAGFPHAFMTAVFDKQWPTALHIRALYGWIMREHVEAEHPDTVNLVAELATCDMPAAEREAWLFGYRFRDMPGPGGDGDG